MVTNAATEKDITGNIKSTGMKWTYWKRRHAYSTFDQQYLSL